jgi:hypothetical protein
MVNDINLADYSGAQINIIGDAGPPFTGVFDGNGHTISNFTYVSTTGCVGIFGYVDDANAVVKDLMLIDPNILTSGPYTGALVGVFHNGTMVNCCVQGGSITASVYGTVGGLIGSSSDATISDCYATCDVFGAAGEVGGLVGLNHSTIMNSYATGNVTGYEVGGLVGINGGDGLISKCHATGDVEGIERVGGLVGDNDRYGCVLDSYSTGNVCGQLCTGGLIGISESDDYPILNCYTTGSVGGNDTTGGLIGKNNSIVSRCYTLGAVSGKDYTGGLIGDNGGVLSYCFATGDVTGGGWITGGLVGINRDVVSDSYSAGNVDGNDIAGGLFGMNCCNLTVNCYSSGRVTGAEYTTGAFVGDDFTNSYGSCFWDKTINSSLEGAGQPICKDYPEYCPMPDPQGLLGKSTAEMQKETTFTDAGWDFVEVWGIGENQTYPFLRQYLAGDVNHDGLVDWRDFAILAGRWL